MEGAIDGIGRNEKFGYAILRVRQADEAVSPGRQTEQAFKRSDRIGRCPAIAANLLYKAFIREVTQQRAENRPVENGIAKSFGKMVILLGTVSRPPYKFY